MRLWRASPCAFNGEPNTEAEELLARSRSCPAEPHPDYHEFHAKIRLPIFQRGELPYTKTGGEVRMDDNNKPLLASYESVCMAITVPKSVEQPEDGWPACHGH